MLADEDVLQGGHGREQAGVLIGARHAHVRDLVRPEAVDRGAVEDELALVDVEEATDAVEEGGLAGTVGTDHAGDRALLHLEIQLAHGDETAEALGDAFRLQECRHRRLPQPAAVRGDASLSTVASSSSAERSSRLVILDGRSPSGR